MWLRSVANNYNLNEEIALQMADETGYVILGLKDRSDFLSSLLQTGMDADTAKKLSIEIDRRIFILLEKVQARETVAPKPAPTARPPAREPSTLRGYTTPLPPQMVRPNNATWQYVKEAPAASAPGAARQPAQPPRPQAVPPRPAQMPADQTPIPAPQPPEDPHRMSGVPTYQKPFISVPPPAPPRPAPSAPPGPPRNAHLYQKPAQNPQERGLNQP